MIPNMKRMIDAMYEIIDLCNTDPCTWRADTTEEDWEKLIQKIDNAAHIGLYGFKKDPA